MSLLTLSSSVVMWRALSWIAVMLEAMSVASRVDRIIICYVGREQVGDRADLVFDMTRQQVMIGQTTDIVPVRGI